MSSNPGNPLDPLKEMAKLLGLNAPAQTEVRQEISMPDDEPRVRLYLPDNGRRVMPDPADESP